MAKKRWKKRRRSRTRARQLQPDLYQPYLQDDPELTQVFEALAGVPLEQMFEQGGLTPRLAYNLTQMSVLQMLGFDEAAAAAFMRWHDELPDDIEFWSEAQLDEVVAQARASGSEEDWMRAMTWLSHHRTRWAAARLDELLDQVPDGLKTFWDLAFAEAAAWLSYKSAEAKQGLALAADVAEPPLMN